MRSDVRLQRYTMQGPVISACPNPPRRSLPSLSHTGTALLTKAWEILQPDAQRTSMCQRGSLAGFFCHRLVHQRLPSVTSCRTGTMLGIYTPPSGFESPCFARVMRTACCQHCRRAVVDKRPTTCCGLVAQAQRRLVTLPALLAVADRVPAS